MRAGFALPAVDADEFEAAFPSPAAAVAALRRGAESNAVAARGPALPRSVAAAAVDTDGARFGEGQGGGQGDAGASVPVTAQALFLTGWSPAATTPTAAPRGSGTVSLADLAAALEEQKKKRPGGA